MQVKESIVTKGAGFQEVVPNMFVNKNGMKVEEVLNVRNVDLATINVNLGSIIKKLTENSDFLKSAEETMVKILADGKVNFTDVPEIVHFIMTSYNNLSNDMKVSKADLPDFVKLVFEFLVNKYNLIDKSKLNEYESMIISSVKLVLLTPNLKADVLKFCSCF